MVNTGFESTTTAPGVHLCAAYEQWQPWLLLEDGDVDRDSSHDSSGFILHFLLHINVNTELISKLSWWVVLPLFQTFEATKSSRLHLSSVEIQPSDSSYSQAAPALCNIPQVRAHSLKNGAILMTTLNGKSLTFYRLRSHLETCLGSNSRWAVRWTKVELCWSLSFGVILPWLSPVNKDNYQANELRKTAWVIDTLNGGINLILIEHLAR